jgi:hypothetical protein
VVAASGTLLEPLSVKGTSNPTATLYVILSRIVGTTELALQFLTEDFFIH